MNSHPFARVFGPVLFLLMVFLSLAFSFGPAQAQPPASLIAAPRIERFDLDPPTRLVAGEALIFRITGSPRSNASVSIEGVDRMVPLREVMTGIYEGAYTIKAGDRIGVHSSVTGRLRFGGEELKTVLAQPLVDTTAVAVSR